MSKAKTYIIVGLIFGVIAAVLVQLRVSDLESRARSVAVLRLKPTVSLPAGSKIERAMLAVENLPENFGNLTKVAVPATESSIEWIVGQKVSQDLPAGAFLLFEHLTQSTADRLSNVLTPGMRAVTVPVNAVSSAAYFVRPGSRIDIIGTFNEVETPPAPAVEPPRIENGRPQAQAMAALAAVPPPAPVRRTVTRTVMQNMKVLAVGSATSINAYQQIGERGYPTVTVEVSPADAEKLIFAMQLAQGGLTLALRHPDDNKPADVPARDWSTIK